MPQSAQFTKGKTDSKTVLLRYQFHLPRANK
jgi:hypothetical protein